MNCRDGETLPLITMPEMVMFVNIDLERSRFLSEKIIDKINFYNIYVILFCLYMDDD